MHKIELKDKRKEEDHGGQPTVGANCEVTIDGKQLEGVRSFKLEVNAAGIAVATIEMYGNFVVDVLGNYEKKLYMVKSPGKEKEAKND